MRDDLVSVVIPCYRDGPRAIAAASLLLSQRLPEGFDLEVVIVDDGSGEPTGANPDDLQDVKVRVLALPRNLGRSSARNAGAADAAGSFLVFMDSDCNPVRDDFLARHLTALSAGATATTGNVVGAGDGFWDRYQRDASMRRERSHRDGTQYAGSSQNLAVRRSAFEAVGGFDAGYRHYGFEDRDLLLRLGELGQIAWVDATVRHLDRFDMLQVGRKMAEAGAFSAPRFASAHPHAYRTLGYERLDARQRPWLQPAARLLDRCSDPLSRAVDASIAKEWLPYTLKVGLVRLATALSYLAGTSRDGPASD